MADPARVARLRRAIAHSEAGEVISFPAGHFTRLAEELGDDGVDDQGGGAMTKWEYDIVAFGEGSTFGGIRGTTGLTDMLNTKGAQGWELVAVTDFEGTSFVFKRSAQEG